MISSFTTPFSCSYFLWFSVFTNTCISTSTVSYNDHCASIIPESIPTVRSNNNSIPTLVTNHYTGGDRLLGLKPSQNPHYHVTKSLKLQITPNYYETKAKGIYKVEANLYIRSPYGYYNKARSNYSYGGSYYNRSRGSITFSLNGFWSESSRRLCMVGSDSWLSEEDQTRNLDAVLKLKFADNNPTLSSSFVSGVLESTNSVNFEPLLIFSFPVFPEYGYSSVLKELDGGFDGDIDVSRNESLNLRFCSMLSGRYFVFELEYATECNNSRNCSPLGEGHSKFLPSFMSLDLIQCSENQRKVRYMVIFRNITRGVFKQDFDAESTLIGEGSWDDEKNRLLITACRILNAVEDCTLRLSLRYPSTWTIRDDAKIVGQIWTNTTKDDNSGYYFRKIKFKSSDENDMVVFPGLRYEYTEFDTVLNLCQFQKLVEKERNRYPNGYSHDMKFDMFVKNWKGQKFAWGDAMPFSVGNKFYSEIGSVSESEKNTVFVVPLNISYKIGIRPFRKFKFDDFFHTFNWSMNLRSRVEITAEGVYDAKTGQLCMVGCRKLLSYNHKSTNHSIDCEILVNFEFPPLYDARKGGFIKGTIRSTRLKQDPLYFEDLSLSSAAFYRTVAKKTIRRMDLETVMVLVSSTLVCLLVGLQLFHVKRNPEVLSSISLVMVVILCLGHMIPLVLNVEAMFLTNRHKPTLNSGLWLEANEIIVRIITMVAFLLQICLLQLVWTARQSEENENGETKAAFVSLSIFVFGELFALLMNMTGKRQGYKDYSILRDLRSYAGLILDGFLLPQVLFNVFRGSVEKALAYPFYIGMSFVRLVPHFYDQYRTQNYGTYDVKGTYYYANHTTGFYSRAWNFVVPTGIVMLAVIIFMQQLYGGHSILTRRVKESGEYEKVSEVNNTERSDDNA